MASYVKYNKFVEDQWNNVHDLFGTDDTLKIMLSNAAPNVATHTVRADVTELGAGSGYTSGGIDTQNNGTRSSGTMSEAGTSVTFTASGGTIGPFQYAILYNDTPAGDPLIAYWNYGSAVTLADGESFTVTIATNLFTMA